MLRNKVLVFYISFSYLTQISLLILLFLPFTSAYTQNNGLKNNYYINYIYKYRVEISKKLREGKLDESKKLANALIIESEKQNNNNGIAWGNYFLGNSMRIKGKSDSALIYYEKAEKMCSLSKDDTLSCCLYQRKGEVYKDNGIFDKSAECFFKALQISESKNIIWFSYETYASLGFVFLAKKEYDKCLEYFKKALKISENENQPSAISISCVRIADIYIKKGNFAKAEEY